MALRIIGISGMSDQEYTDVRKQLNKNNIPFYVTPPGNWGLSMEAIWVKNDSDIQKAHDALKDYYHLKNIEYSEKLKADNKNKNIMQKLLSNTNVVAFYLPTLVIVLLMVFLLT